MRPICGEGHALPIRAPAGNLAAACQTVPARRAGQGRALTPPRARANTTLPLPRAHAHAGVTLFFDDLMRAPRNVAEAATAAVRAIASTAATQSTGGGVAGFTSTSGSGK